MKHYGDITKLSGWTLPIVDAITGGSPCQDLSVAGKRAGLDGERSGLFMEQIRIVKEMRERDRRENGRAGYLCRPRFMVWENVPGAFSSNKGRDFQAVLTEIVRITEQGAPDVPMPERGGWSKSGCLYGELGSWSVAWRLHDAQYWGVPQRRKRICVLADFGGLAAPEILFDPQLWRTTEDGEPISPDRYSGTESGPEIQTQPESLPGDSSKSGAPGEGTAAVAGHSLETEVDGRIVCYGISAFDSNAMKSPNPYSGIYKADTARTLDLNGGSPACNQGGMAVVTLNENEVAGTLTASYGTKWNGNSGAYSGENFVIDGKAVLCLNDQGGQNMDVSDGVSGTLRAQDHGHPPLVLIYDARGNGDGEICPTLTGDHQNRVTDYTALAIPINTMVGTRDNEEMRTCLGIGKPGDPQFSISAAHCHAVCIGNGQANQISMKPIANTLDTMADVQKVLVIYAPDVGHSLKAKENLQFREDAETYIVTATGDQVCQTLVANAFKGTGNTQDGFSVCVWPEVRRLTPLECTRLQGFPDGWLDIGDWMDDRGKLRKEADAPKYKAAGNSIALPWWSWLARRICAEYERPITMGSLFDGIGGFPLAFSRAGATPVWASEIEPFPIAVTKKHFPEEEGK